MPANFSVSWNGYEKNICKGLGALQQRGEFVDMTLAAEGHYVKVHQMVMSLVSPFIKDLISSANCPHPVIFFNRVSYQTVQAILEYAYTGEVVVRENKMMEFLEACKELHIKGLENMLNNARSAASNPNSKIGTERDKPEDDREDYAFPSNSNRKRSKKESFEEIVESKDDDDLHPAGVIVEAPKSLSPDTTGNAEDMEKSSLLENTENIPTKSSPIQYSVSCQGNLQLVLNRYLYTSRHARKNDERFWRCISQQTTGCRANVTTLRGKLMARTFSHNHSFHDVQILKRVKNGNMFKSLTQGEEAARKRKREETDPFKKALNEIIDEPKQQQEQGQNN